MYIFRARHLILFHCSAATIQPVPSNSRINSRVTLAVKGCKEINWRPRQGRRRVRALQITRSSSVSSNQNTIPNPDRSPDPGEGRGRDLVGLGAPGAEPHTRSRCRPSLSGSGVGFWAAKQRSLEIGLPGFQIRPNFGPEIVNLWCLNGPEQSQRQSKMVGQFAPHHFA